MPLESIRRQRYPEADRSEVQERVARAIEADAEPFFARYQALAQSFDGRYVCSDLFKETFPEFSVSNEARGRYNNPLHNSAAVLASEQFSRRVHDASRPEQDTVIFLTGVPGAGKTTAILSEDRLEANVRMVYEGQLARPDSVLPKIAQVLDAGLQPVIVAVHTPAEVALANTLRRFERHGRGASVEAMASIQGNLPDGLAAIHARFGDAVQFQLFDRRQGLNQT
ncbi:MAG: zeta toxin family protein, partial [Rhodospirillales bacterium]|nr:zeta toxin family protein [Acetobacter sp.]